MERLTRGLVLAAALAVGAAWVLSGVAPVRAGAGAGPERAVAVLRPVGNSGVSGTIYFVRQENAIEVTGTIRGLTPGMHGFHVHQFGDLTDPAEGLSAGGHYNPTQMPHGRPESARRHVGDLGNVTANAQGVATLNMRDRVIRLSGPHAILGRALVVHSEADKFTQPSGDSGARVAFGVIGIAEPAGK